MQVVVEADGGSRGNPGPAGYGAVVLDPATGAVLAERSGAIGVATNNVAEYRGLIAGLQAAGELGATSVAVRMDSKLVVEQMSGRWQIKHPSMQPLAREARSLGDRFDDVTFEWIPRERNQRADRLANQAMDAAAGGPARSAPAPEVPAASWTLPDGVPTRVLLLRHGSTVHSPDRRYSGRNDLSLSAAGAAEVAGLAARVASRYADVAALVTSPLVRARESAAAVATELGLSPYVSEGFAELDFGEWEGLTAAAVTDKWPAEQAAWLESEHVAPPGGESMSALARRVRRARDELIAAHPGRTVAVVSHVTPIKTLLRLALDAPYSTMFRISLDVASMSVIEYYPNGAAVVRLVNGT